jgi:hypothetical protein
MAVTRSHGNKGTVQFVLSPAGAAPLPIKSWECTKTCAAADATTSEDAGYDNVTAGNKKMTGSAACLWDKSKDGDARPTELQEGDEVVLQLYPTAGTGYYNVPALITDVPVRVSNTESAAWSFSFVNMGAWAWVPEA